MLIVIRFERKKVVEMAERRGIIAVPHEMHDMKKHFRAFDHVNDTRAVGTSADELRRAHVLGQTPLSIAGIEQVLSPCAGHAQNRQPANYSERRGRVSRFDDYAVACARANWVRDLVSRRYEKNLVSQS